jgi:hypothetical protein
MTIRINLVESVISLSWETDHGVAGSEVRLSTFHSSSIGISVKAQPTGLIAKSYSWRDFSTKAAESTDLDVDAAKLIAREILEYSTTGQNPSRGLHKLTHGPVMCLGVMGLADTIRSLVKATDEGQLTRD